MTRSSFQCQECGAANPVDHNFCSNCGASIRTLICPLCDAVNAYGDSTCYNCGCSFGINSRFSIVGRKDERKFITAFFADIKGSVEMMAKRDIEEARHVIDSVILKISSIIRKYQGTIVDTVGDGVFGVFGAPQSFDGHPRAAVNAALELQESMGSIESKASPIADVKLRIGIHTGEVIWRALQVGLEMRHLPVGQSVNQASRLQNFADPGAIIIGETTYELVKDYFSFTQISNLQLKGIAKPVVAYKVLQASDIFRNLQISIKRGLSPLVGREHELAILGDCIKAVETGKGEVLILVSDAGGGKSRLLHEVTRLIPEHYKVVETFCLSHLQSSPWYSAVQLLRHLFGLSPGMPIETIKHQLTNKLIGLDPSLEKDVATLLQLFDLETRSTTSVDSDPSIRRRKYIALTLQLLSLTAKLVPLVIFIEDLQWLDSQSAELLDQLMSLTDVHPILLLCTSRPEGIREKWRARDHSILQFGNLEESAARQLISSLICSKELSGSTIQQIQNKTQGNPFFIEEVIRSLQSNSPEALADNAPTIDSSLIPSTIQMAIAERIDRLPHKYKQSLQVLAVVGIKSRESIFLKLIADRPGQGAVILSRLEELGFICRVKLDSEQYVQFVHILTQEVAYSYLLSESRSKLHEHIGDTMASEYGDLIHEILPELAYHYQQSNNAQKAVEYLRLAGDSAIQRSAHLEAQNYIKLGLSRLESSSEISDDLVHLSHLWLSLGVSLQVTLGYAAEDVKTAYENAVRFSEQADDSECLLAALRGYAVYTGVRANYQEVEKIATRLKKLSKGIQAYALEHLILHGLSFSYRGQLERGAKYYRKGIALRVDPAQSTSIQYSGYSRSICYSYYALNALYAGRLRLAREHAKKGLEVAISSGISIAVAQSRGMYANVLFSRCDFVEAEQQHEINIAYADENGFSYWSLLGRLITCWTNGHLRGVTTSVGEFKAYLSAYQNSGALIGMPWFLNLYAELLWRFDQPENALAIIDESEGVAASTEEQFFLVDTLRLKGELLLDSSGNADAVDAYHSFLQALQLAHAQGAWLPAMRTAVQLARLLMHVGCQDDARSILAFYYKKIAWIKCPIHEEVWRLMMELSIDRRFLATANTSNPPLSSLLDPATGRSPLPPLKGSIATQT